MKNTSKKSKISKPDETCKTTTITAENLFETQEQPVSQPSPIDLKENRKQHV